MGNSRRIIAAEVGIARGYAFTARTCRVLGATQKQSADCHTVARAQVAKVERRLLRLGQSVFPGPPPSATSGEPKIRTNPFQRFSERSRAFQNALKHAIHEGFLYSGWFFSIDFLLFVPTFISILGSSYYGGPAQGVPGGFPPP